MIKVLGLALYWPLTASNRYRLGQYVPGSVKCHLLGDDYLRARFGGGEFPIAAMVKAGLAPIEDLWHQKHQNDFETVMLQCEMIPLMPG